MEFSSPAASAVFAEYDARHQRERALMRDLPAGEFGDRRDEFLLPIGARAGGFLRALIRGKEPKRILELGTSYGYSTLFLADAAQSYGGQVISVDLDAAKQDYAAGMLARAGFADTVEFRCGDAIKLIAADPGPLDFVLLDIWKNQYLPCFEAVYPKLAEEGIIASDNMIQPASARDAVRRYRAAITAKEDLQTMLLPVGSGIELSIRWSAGNPKL
ncbi:O-methyltransferase [Altericroceibacterium xinjiangense]|uniref:O-methyltransferase n=1 Tax=Altericroceibacterium xinjiangense TaxID=762261 RepID=UPI000F7EA563|nr:class I SAM-dependent methyltransferase [Altericroceibacterium xinjiangense]